MAALFIQDYDKTTNLLQVLDLGTDQILVSLDPDNRYAIVAHVSDDLANQLAQLVMS